MITWLLGMQGQPECLPSVPCPRGESRLLIRDKHPSSLWVSLASLWGTSERVWSWAYWSAATRSQSGDGGTVVRPLFLGKPFHLGTGPTGQAPGHRAEMEAWAGGLSEGRPGELPQAGGLCTVGSASSVEGTD